MTVCGDERGSTLCGQSRSVGMGQAWNERYPDRKIIYRELVQQWWDILEKVEKLEKEESDLLV